MPKIHTLKDLTSGESIYPITGTGAVYDSSGNSLDERLNALEGIRDQLSTELAKINDTIKTKEQTLTSEIEQKQPKLSVSDDLALSDKSELSLTEMAKMRLFIDQWNSACRTYGNAGSYNPKTGFFELLNLTDITYEQAIPILNAFTGQWHKDSSFAFNQLKNVRAMIPVYATNSSRNLQYAFLNTNIEAYAESSAISNIEEMFRLCAKLKYVHLNMQYVSNATDTFKGCVALENAKLYDIKISISISDSPLLSFDSVEYLLTKAANTTSITVTLHPDVYAKITDETNPDYAQWHPLLALAESKNISLATV